MSALHCTLLSAPLFKTFRLVSPYTSSHASHTSFANSSANGVAGKNRRSASPRAASSCSACRPDVRLCQTAGRGRHSDIATSSDQYKSNSGSRWIPEEELYPEEVHSSSHPPTIFFGYFLIRPVHAYDRSVRCCCYNQNELLLSTEHL